MRVLIVHGPNLGLLGHRDPAHYGTESLADLDARLARRAEALSVTVESRQSNHEGELIDWLQGAAFDGAGVGPRADAIVFNPGGFSHTSVAIRDAVEAVVESGVPVIEVHLSNVHGREAFRERLLTGAAARGVITGMGPVSYELGLEAAVRLAGTPNPGV